MSKITESANQESCALRFPGCMNDRATVVWCHSPFIEDGKGWGIKAPDVLGTYGCGYCHDILDRRKATDVGIEGGESYTKFLQEYFHRGLKRSLVKLIDKGVLK